MIYPYQGRNLFESPERYSYAQCASPDFLASWQSYRQEVLAKLAAISRPRAVNQQIAPGKRPAPSDGRSIDEILTAILVTLQAAESGLNNANTELTSLATKFEAFRRLHSHYDVKFRKHPEAHLATLDSYLLFGSCLVLAAEKFAALNYLSTLLKLNDALASAIDDEWSASHANRFADILERESALVNTWANK